jgi:hypothetical protein
MLRTIRLTRGQLAGVVAFSAIATAVVIAAAGGRWSVAAEAAALLRDRQIVVHHLPTATAAANDATSGAGAGALLASGTPAASATSASSSASSSSSSSSNSTAPTSTNTTTTAANTTSSTTKATVHAKHVFVIALSSTGYAAAFGHGSAAPYLDGTLRRKGTLLTHYHSLGGSELPDFLAMVSGQRANAETRANCVDYDDFGGGARPNAAGVVTGAGCVYPNTVTTIADQVNGAGENWKAYIAGMGKQSCAHPNDGAEDDAVLPFATSEYDTRHNPFIYFHSLLDLGGCSTGDVNLGQLPGDLRSASQGPQYAFIAPPLCDDASATSCPDGQPGGIAGENAFLRQWVPRILASRAYHDGGVLIIAFAPSSAATATVSTTPASTTTPAAGTSTSTTPSPVAIPAAGGSAPVRTGALIISRWATAGRRLNGSYGPDSLLRSVEQLLGLKPLGLAAGATSFVGAALPHF